MEKNGEFFASKINIRTDNYGNESHDKCARTILSCWNDVRGT